MSKTLEKIRRLVQDGTVRVSEHGYDELAADKIPVREIVAGIAEAIVVEDYPDYAKAPVFSYDNLMVMASPSMLFGESLKAR